MLKIVRKLPVYLFCLLSLSLCIDPYHPQLGDYDSILVVEGLVTDEKVPYEVMLSRTFQSIDSLPRKIADARVYITDESGSEADLYYHGNGLYKTDSALFTGESGSTYTLHIEMSDGSKYESEPCIMTSVTGIDSVYYLKDEEISSTLDKALSGIKIYLDTEETLENKEYFRWEYEETWKFKLPFPKRYDYVNETTIVELDKVKEYCWKSNKSGEIITGSILPGQSNELTQKPLVFIPADQSDRLNLQYSILVKQYSVSQKEFDFWNNLKQVNENGGDIYDKQPYSVISNVHNIGNPDERVLGYFKVSAVKKKRIFITQNDLLPLKLPYYKYNCESYPRAPKDYPSGWAPPTTFDEIYEMWMDAGGFTFVEPVYDKETRELLEIVFARNECSDCEMAGSTVKPDFWIDMP
jgi:hypothetical protein